MLMHPSVCCARRYVREHARQCGIVYCLSKRDCETMAEKINKEVAWPQGAAGGAGGGANARRQVATW